MQPAGEMRSGRRRNYSRRKLGEIIPNLDAQQDTRGDGAYSTPGFVQCDVGGVAPDGHYAAKRGGSAWKRIRQHEGGRYQPRNPKIDNVSGHFGNSTGKRA